MHLIGISLAYLVFILVFAIGVCWLWPDFVDSSEPWRVRSLLYTLLFVQTVFEVGICYFGLVSKWLLLVLLLSNGWGMLDAFLRYPAVHEIDSLFGLKQVFLMLVKLVGYMVFFHDIVKNVGWFVLIILWCVFTLPIVWLTALPIGDYASYHQKHDSVDMDIVLRLWGVVRKPTDRESAMLFLRRTSRQGAVYFARRSPFLTSLLVRFDPSLARVLRKAPVV
eukprot:TRINITY_DN74689_c0_g1_i1.p1 TRINITY_DN74689_c0_g1~~TRINITY_DN74689_c0_g1_i1.p1  ORF type:complete len:222 (-),score=16.94 TRINITY_DN74689_c0_g1_i1:212-877(-)